MQNELTSHPLYDPLLKIDEAAKYLCVSAVHLRLMATEKKIAVVRTCYQQGSPLKFRLSALNSWSKSHEVKPGKGESSKTLKEQSRRLEALAKQWKDRAENAEKEVSVLTKKLFSAEAEVEARRCQFQEIWNRLPWQDSHPSDNRRIW